ncbi:carboxypeptidase M32 [Salibacterium aidingense]|uniref:carboxypeptidase M32 n=1 Tax=Salibacterium aidingense TaxID=384933 RepID=UPI0003F75B7F|nr:carboxypeptidase M32 [Salibacterium aidingense]
MTDSIKTTEKAFYEHMQKMSSYEQALGLLQWDARTKIPKKGADSRAEVIGMLSTELFKLKTSDTSGRLVHRILEADSNELSTGTKRAAEELKKEYDRSVQIPEPEFQEYSILTSKAESVWETAKDNNDFESFRPYLEKIVDFSRKFTEYWGYEGHPYNALLKDYEPDMTVGTLDAVFQRLRERLVPLVEDINASPNRPETDFLFRTFPKENQQAVSETILEQMTYDFEAGRLDETVHPFALGLNPNDVRVTTKYDKMDFRTAVFGTIHEGGHALYEQNLPAEWRETVLCDAASMGIHESQSLFWENFVGRSKAFWEKNYDLLKAYSNGQFEKVPLDDFYRAVNEAKPSFIRIEADELTYSLHIIARYEIEKKLINGDLQVKDLPEVWNEKMEQYLGITPPTDREGVLQDVHWSFGAFGYFPSYALGYIYAAQLHHAVRKEFPDLDSYIRSGNLSPVKQWLTTHVHQYGKTKTPADIMKDTTGEGINPDYLITYLEDKYKPLYRL